MALLIMVSTGRAAVAEDASELRVGYQKYGSLILLKGQGTLDRRLAALGIKVRWTEFPAGPQLLEGLNVGSIDFGVTGETPPVFAQAAGAPIAYVGYEPPAPAGEAILVHKASAINSVADLKGKKVALNKGSNVHYLLVRTLAQSGLRYSDIQPVYLPPADGRAAFERGSVDAWVIWDPFLATAQRTSDVRVLADGRGLVNNHQFYLAQKRYAEAHPDIIAVVFEELSKTDAWAKANPRLAAAALAQSLRLDAATVELAVQRSSFGVRYIDQDVIAEQQRIADAFFALQLIPKKLAITEAIWTPNHANASQAGR